MSNNSDNKIIHIISPITGMEFKIELNGNEKCLRELLGTILEIPPSSIKGIRDSYSNYYTLSSALKSKNINTDPNNYFSVISECNNNDYNLGKYSINSNNYNNKEIVNNTSNYCYPNSNFITDDSLFLLNNRINRMQNIQNFPIAKIRNNFFTNNFYRNYSTKDYYYLINFLYQNNYIDNKNYYKLKKCIDINNQDVLDIMKPFIEFDDDYDKLINNLFPILNLDLAINEDFNLNNNYGVMRFDSNKKILNSLKAYFTSDNIKELNYLLLMENIDILKIFKLYYKTKDKKNLIDGLYDVLKKVSKLNISSKTNNKMKARKSKSINYSKFSKKSIKDSKSKINKDLLNKITNKIFDYGKQFTKDVYYLMKIELKNASEENKISIFESKFKINLKNVEKGEFSLNSSIKKNIKYYYNKFIQTNIYKFLNSEEKKIYENIKEETSSQEYHDLMQIYSEMVKNSKSKNKMEMLRNKIINYIKQFIEQNEEENEEEKQSKETEKNKDTNSSKNNKDSEEEDNIIKIETNEEEEEEQDDKKEKNEQKDSSIVSSTVMDVEEENNEQYSEEESGVSIRKANRPKKN